MAEQLADVDWVVRFLKDVAPRGELQIRKEALFPDECKWFRAGVEERVVEFRECGEECPRRKKHGESWSDEFVCDGQSQPRHLFSLSKPVELNREYIPHVAAYTRMICDLGYDPLRSTFSYYRAFTRDLVVKKKGQSYETDIEFLDRGGAVYIEVEVKKSQEEIEKLAAAVEGIPTSGRMPKAVAKEIEYVLELQPEYLWLVGPGSVDPERHVYSIEANPDELQASFQNVDRIPRPPS